MGIVIGIDVGGSTTKIVGIDGQTIRNPMFIKAADPIASLFGAFGKYIYDNGIALSDIEQVMLTGVGSSSIDRPLYGLPTGHADEFQANGLGAQYASNLNELIVVSMGTGTSFVQVTEQEIRHIGGIGIGGGTLTGLSRLLLKTQDIRQIVEIARKGEITHINLSIRDICNKPLPGLPLDATASIFGKAGANSSPEDVALGILYMVLQNIGQAAVLAARNSTIRDFVLIGNLAKLPQCREIFPRLETLYDVRFRIPEYAEYRTAVGAALAFLRRAAYTQVD